MKVKLGPTDIMIQPLDASRPRFESLVDSRQLLAHVRDGSCHRRGLAFRTFGSHRCFPVLETEAIADRCLSAATSVFCKRADLSFRFGWGRHHIVSLLCVLNYRPSLVRGFFSARVI